MKKILPLTTLALLLGSTNLYAHHPAADIVDPDIYAMIDENVSDAHQELTFDDMGSDSVDAGGEMQASNDDLGNMGADMEEFLAAMETREEMNTMVEVEADGPMNGQR